MPMLFFIRRIQPEKSDTLLGAKHGMLTGNLPRLCNQLKLSSVVRRLKPHKTETYFNIDRTRTEQNRTPLGTVLSQR